MAPVAACRRQLVLAGALLSAAFVLLGFRLYGIQIQQRDALTGQVDRMLMASDRQAGHRGDIRSLDGTLWAREVTRYTVAVDPKVLRGAALDEVIEIAASILDIPRAVRQEKLRRLENNRRAVREGTATLMRYLALARRVPPARARKLQTRLREHFGKRGSAGVIIKPTHSRQYPKDGLMGPVIGWVGMGETADEIAGAAGLELALDSYLASFDGHRLVLKDGLQRNRFVWSEDIDIKPINGHDVVLTIDGRIQRIVTEELEKGVRAQNAAAGLALVLRCENGDILAMASYPGFDPNMVHLYPPEELRRRRKNRPVENVYEPGSTIKVFWAAGALEARVIGRDEVVWGGGRTTRLRGRRVSDVSDHGQMTLEDAVVYSSNIGMAHVGLRLGKHRLNDILGRFHFQEKTGVLLPGEVRGKRPRLATWSEKYATISVSFGFEVSMTPLQLGAAYVSLVNGGRYFVPRLVARLERGDEIHRFAVRERGRPISEETSRQMREILRRVVEHGTGRRWAIADLPFGGKTGTAALSKGKAGYAAGGKEYLSSFVAFAPYPEPEVVVLVLVEKPRGKSYYGSTVCGPVIQGILGRTYRLRDY